MGSHAKEVTHFEWPFRGSPMGLPDFGSQSLTYAIENRPKKVAQPGERREGSNTRLDVVFEAGSSDRNDVMSRTHMSIVSSCSELPLHGLPLSTEHPAIVA